MRHVFLLSCLAAASVGLVLGETYVVTPDGTGDFPTIQAAVDAAQDGDIIELTDGTFSGDGNRDIEYLGKPVTIRSRSGDPRDCIIDCGGSPDEHHRGFYFHAEGRESVIEGVTIANGYHGWGAGIAIDLASPTVRGCILLRNTATDVGGGIYMDIWGQPLIWQCSFVENSANAGGGMCI